MYSCCPLCLQDGPGLQLTFTLVISPDSWPEVWPGSCHWVCLVHTLPNMQVRENCQQSVTLTKLLLYLIYHHNTQGRPWPICCHRQDFMTRACMHVHGCGMTTKTERYGHKMCANVFSILSISTWLKWGVDLTSSRGVRGHAPPGRSSFFFILKLKASIWCTLRAKLRDLLIHLSTPIWNRTVNRFPLYFTNHSPFKLYSCLLITTFFYCHIVFYTCFKCILIFL